MADKKKKRSLWRNVVRREPSQRYSMIETGSQRSLDRSMDDMSSTPETPGTVTTGSLDRLTALNSKPPKSGFFQLKPKTPAFWKPLFNQSSTTSSSSLNTCLRKSQLVQTDSPTQPSTTDFGVQAVIVGRSTHTRDVLVQTCPAWDGRPSTLASGLEKPGEDCDPNKGRKAVDAACYSCGHSSVTYVPTEVKVLCETKGSFASNSISDNADSIGSANESGAFYCASNMTESLPSTGGRILALDNARLFPSVPDGSLVSNEQKEDNRRINFVQEYDVKERTIRSFQNSRFGSVPEIDDFLCSVSFNNFSAANTASSPLSAVKEDFAKLNRDLDVFEDFSKDVPVKMSGRKTEDKNDGIIIDSNFDVLREGVSPSEDIFRENGFQSCDAEECQVRKVESPEINKEIALATNSRDGECISASYSNITGYISQHTDHPVEERGEENRLNANEKKYPHSFSCNSKKYDLHDIHGKFSNFDCCENLEELENEIIRSLCSPVLTDSEASQTSPCNGEILQALEKSPQVNSKPDDLGLRNDDGESSSGVSVATRRDFVITGTDFHNEKEPQQNRHLSVVYFPLENITEESNTDEDSVRSFRQHDEAAKLVSSENSECQEKSDADTNANSDRDKEVGNESLVNETSQVVIEVPPRKAKIFVNVLELGNLRAVAEASEIATENTNLAGSNSQHPNEPFTSAKKAENFILPPSAGPEGNDRNESKETENRSPCTAEYTSDEKPTKSRNEVQSSDSSPVISCSHIVLKSALSSNEVPAWKGKDEQHPEINQSVLPPQPPPPPPMPTSDDLAKASRVGINTSSRSPTAALSKSTSASTKSPVMLELEQRFLSRQKMANDLEPITKKIVTDVNKETEAWTSSENNRHGTSYDSSKFSSPRGFQKANGLQNGTNGTSEPFQRTPSPASKSPPLSTVGSMTNGGAESGFSGQTIITDQPPPPGAVLVDSKVTVEGDKIHTDRYYALPVKEVLKEKTSTTKFIAAPEKYEGIGPTEEGIPVCLRQSVKKENMSDWYKTMYKTLHKIDSDRDTYIIGYTSDPEHKKEDKPPKRDKSPSRDVLLNGPLSPSYQTSTESAVKILSVKPGSIEDYEPGHSSVISSKENISRRHLPDSNYPKSSYEVKDGYESEGSIIKKQNQSNGITPENQKIWYRQVQRGGDVPPCGLGKPAPEKPKDPVIGPPPLPPQPLYNYQVVQSQKASRPETLPPDYTNNGADILCAQSNGTYAQQMRQIIQSEMQQKSYRVLSPLNNKPVKKYPERKVPARTLFNFTAETPREISLKKGDIVYIFRELDRNWYEGECKGLVGIFPISYVEILPPEHAKQNEVREGLAKVLYDFPAQTSVELHAKKGEEIQLIRKVDENWYEGKIRDRKGIIPCSYISIIQEPGSSPHTPSSQSLLSPRSTRDSHSSPISSPSLSTKSVSSNVAPYAQNGHSSTGRAKKGSRLVEPVLYQAMYRYTPQNADELELIEGDTLYVVEMCDDGWYVGTSVRTGELGIVPGNYLEKV